MYVGALRSFWLFLSQPPPGGWCGGPRASPLPAGPAREAACLCAGSGGDLRARDEGMRIKIETAGLALGLPGLMVLCPVPKEVPP